LDGVADFFPRFTRRTGYQGIAVSTTEEANPVAVYFLELGQVYANWWLDTIRFDFFCCCTYPIRARDFIKLDTDYVSEWGENQ
jgi:hypothetical protein